MEKNSESILNLRDDLNQDQYFDEEIKKLIYSTNNKLLQESLTSEDYLDIQPIIINYLKKRSLYFDLKIKKYQDKEKKRKDFLENILIDKDKTIEQSLITALFFKPDTTTTSL